MPTLHTVNQSPSLGSAMDSCLRLSLEGCGILLLEDGVLACVAGTDAGRRLQATMRSRQVYALGEDLAARGIPAQRLIRGLNVVDYEGFVDLCVRYGKVQAWF